METESDRILDGAKKGVETPIEEKLRPLRFADFPGQTKVKDKLQVFVSAALKRAEPLDHTLLCGPPGLGKTTLAHILAEAMGVSLVSTSGPALHRKGDVAAILTGLKPGSVFFIDEIHRLSRDVEEYLYSAMEDFYIDLVTGDGLGARAMRFQLAPFTLVGATTRAGLLKGPFRDRFGIIERLHFYTRAELIQVLERSARVLGYPLSATGAEEIARRSRGTPRIANRLIKRVRDYALVQNKIAIDAEIAAFALNSLEVDQLGLDDMDRRILLLIRDKFNGGPVGVETISAALSEDVGTLEEVYEPFLLQEGLIQKTPRGRILTEVARLHLQTLEVT